MSFAALLEQLGSTAFSVFLAVLPLVVLFLLFQVLFLDLPVREVKRVLVGTLVALIALAPLMSVMALGLIVRWKERPKESRT